MAVQDLDGDFAVDTMTRTTMLSAIQPMSNVVKGGTVIKRLEEVRPLLMLGEMTEQLCDHLFDTFKREVGNMLSMRSSTLENPDPSQVHARPLFLTHTGCRHCSVKLTEHHVHCPGYRAGTLWSTTSRARSVSSACPATICGTAPSPTSGSRRCRPLDSPRTRASWRQAAAARGAGSAAGRSEPDPSMHPHPPRSTSAWCSLCDRATYCALPWVVERGRSTGGK